MRESPKALATTLTWKLVRGPRVMTGSNGNNARDERCEMGNPQGYFLSPTWQDMEGSQRLNGCRSAKKDHQS